MNATWGLGWSKNLKNLDILPPSACLFQISWTLFFQKLLLFLVACCQFLPSLNSLAPGKCGNNFKIVISHSFLRTDILSIPCEIVLRGMPQNPFDDKSKLVQVIAWSITRSNVDQDLCCHMVSQGHNELICVNTVLFRGHVPWKKEKRHFQFWDEC